MYAIQLRKKTLRSQWNLNPWPLWYQCSALDNWALKEQLGEQNISSGSKLTEKDLNFTFGINKSFLGKTEQYFIWTLRDTALIETEFVERCNNGFMNDLRGYDYRDWVGTQCRQWRYEWSSRLCTRFKTIAKDRPKNNL